MSKTLTNDSEAEGMEQTLSITSLVRSGELHLAQVAPLVRLLDLNAFDAAKWVAVPTSFGCGL